MLRRLSFAAIVLALLSGNVSAFDCAAAKTRIETSICADPALKSLDDRLEVSYGEVRRLSTKAERLMLARSQKSWIASRESNCPSSPLGLSACIRDMTSARLRMFEGEPESGPGAKGRIIPVFISQEGSTETYLLDINMLRFAQPQTAGEKVFNGIARDIARRITVGRHGEDTEGRIHAMEEYLTLTFASPDFISVLHSYWYDTGGAHGNGGVENVNIDMGTGRIISIDDVLDERGADRLTRFCKTQIVAEKTLRWAGEAYDPANDTFLKDEVIAEHVATLSRWSISASEVVITFDSYAIGSFAEGSYDCRFPLAEVKSLAVAGAVLP